MPFLISFLISISLATSESVIVPDQYIQQGQHSAFLFFGINGEAFYTLCSLDEPEHVGANCSFYFEEGDNNYTLWNVQYNDLKKIEPLILKELKDLQKEWLELYPVGGWRDYVFLFRDENHSALAQIIEEIETESLQHRMLLEKDRATPLRKEPAYIYDRTLMERIRDIFAKHLIFKYQKK